MTRTVEDRGPVESAFNEFMRSFEAFKLANDARLEKLERSHVIYPQSADEAEVMQKAGYHYLKQNNPERLTDLARSYSQMREALEAARDAIASLDFLALGGQYANHPEEQEFSVRDELLARIAAALSLNPTTGGAK
jgi:predicted phage gp36 major capsid-like protein